MSALFYEKFLLPEMKNLEEHKGIVWAHLCLLYLFGKKLHVYLDEPDDHRNYVAKNSLESYDDSEKYKDEIEKATDEELIVQSNWGKTCCRLYIEKQEGKMPDGP